MDWNSIAKLRNPLGRGPIVSALRAAGLSPRSWSFRLRLTQDAYAAWLKIPAATGEMFGSLGAEERGQRIDAALALVDRSSWRWERWRGWTAWKL